MNNANFTKSIDLSRPLGSISGSQSVSNSGSSNYSIPIATPFTTNGLSPTISIAYNSLSSNSIVGYGWSINGLSAFGRNNKNTYYNQQTAPISLINDDLLSLDGNKLMLISGNYGVANSTYGYEMETYASIRAVSLGGNDIWFQVKTKDGNSIEFGNGNNSRVTGQNGRTLFWKINKIIDNEGNYIEFKYVNVDFENLIEDINFTGNQNAGLLPYNNIHFSYLNRFDKNTNYIYGEKSK